MEDMAATAPAAQIILEGSKTASEPEEPARRGGQTHQGWEPKPYQASCSSWKPRPRRTVFLLPMVLIRRLRNRV